MTLSRWLRDYVYIPLGGNRGRRPILTYRNLLLTMLIGGLWHGAAWTFVVWGGLHGAALAGERLLARAPRLRRAPDDRRGRAGARAIVTFHFVCLAWIFFRADSFGAAWDMIGGLFTGWGEASPLVTSGVLLAIARRDRLAVPPGPDPAARDGTLLAAARSLGQATVLAFALMLTSAMGPEGVAPFIYFQF